jgi:hypothetical protein
VADRKKNTMNNISTRFQRLRLVNIDLEEKKSV